MNASRINKLILLGAMALSSDGKNIYKISTEAKPCTDKVYIEAETCTDITAVTSQQINAWPSVYNTVTSSFIQRADGIEDAFLNKVNASFYKEDEYITYFNSIDSLENIGTWRPLTDGEAGLSQLGTSITAMTNFQTIAHVDNTPRKDLEDKLIPLKDVMISLDSIYTQNLKPRERLRRMYDFLTDHIRAGKITPNSVPIETLASGTLGDCNDVSPAFYSLLTYYGFDAYMRFGKSIADNGKEAGYHAWVGVDLKEGYIDLDPTWYATFAPLEDRCPKIEYVGLRDEYVIKKSSN